MQIIHILAETLNYFTINLFLLLQKFFHLNFTFVSYVLKSFQDLKESILEYILPVLSILRCYYQDLIVFLYEVIDIIQFLLKTTINILQSICIRIVYVVNNFTNLIHAVYQIVLHFLFSVKYAVIQVCELVIYFLQLLFDSLLLILQLGPNLMILLYDISKECFYYLLEVLLNSVTSLTENIFYASNRCTEAVYSIPVKAYIGALLLAILFHQYKIVFKYLKAYFALMILLLLEVGNFIIYVVFICLKPVTVLKCIFFSEETHMDEADLHHRRERNSKLVQAYNLFQRYSYRIKTFFKKYLIRGKYAEEQIEQLQKELLAEREKHTCIICFDRPRSIIIHPCRHMCICEECSANWFTDLQRCPLCRQTIFDVYSVYT